MDTMKLIFDLLSKKGIKQGAFSDAIGVKAQVVSDWKAGRSKSYIKYIDRIATYLNVPVDYLLGQTEDPRPASDCATLSAENCVIINGKKKKLSAKEAEQLIKLMEAVGITGPNFFD